MNDAEPPENQDARIAATVDRDLVKAARKRAIDLDISFSEYLRRLIEADLNEGRSSTRPEAA